MTSGHLVAHYTKCSLELLLLKMRVNGLFSKESLPEIFDFQIIFLMKQETLLTGYWLVFSDYEYTNTYFALPFSIVINIVTLQIDELKTQLISRLIVF